MSVRVVGTLLLLVCTGGPAGAGEGAASQATAFEALQAVAGSAASGVRYDAYVTQTSAARQKVQRYLQEPIEDDTDIRAAMLETLSLYVAASEAWWIVVNSPPLNRDHLHYVQSRVGVRCLRFENLLQKADPELAAGAVPALWACAASALRKLEIRMPAR
jgi:hypothetical protein